MSVTSSALLDEAKQACEKMNENSRSLEGIYTYCSDQLKTKPDHMGGVIEKIKMYLTDSVAMISKDLFMMGTIVNDLTKAQFSELETLTNSLKSTRTVCNVSSSLPTDSGTGYHAQRDLARQALHQNV